MSRRTATIVLLAEDSRQAKLVREYLARIGHRGHVRVNMAPNGQGSGEQYVREHYASEVNDARRQNWRRICLITVVDADTNTTAYRRRQLIADPERSASEPILVLVPKRNVETWILCLTNHAVDEDSDFRYDRRVHSSAIKTAASALFDWTRRNAAVPDSCVPSLRESLPEFDRIPAV